MLRQRLHIFLLAVTLFVVAVYIYVSNRGANLALYEWLGIDYYNGLFEYVRAHSCTLTPWVKYNLPDGLWLLSFLLFMDGIWENERRMKWIFSILIIVFAFVLECMQFVGYFSGTGDIGDVIAYIAAILLFLIINKLKQISYEKFN